MIGYLLLVIIKIMDNLVLTLKSISTYYISYYLSANFYLMIDQVINDNTLMVIVIVSFTSGIGNYIAFEINSLFKNAVK